ncbi:putative F-box domain, leucine-rich repeat domain superfamily, F-box-like domain superfamily [Helianthus annuus]|nr:putative F-box domain, leucine-rich repeat domain superfamily, F-box-like domain superfamily [Helianthus annuus]
MDWNEFPVHCLVQVLTRVGMESLVQTVPLVCKSWYDATFYPQCWQRLVFHKSPYNLQIPKSSWLGFGLLHQHTEEDALEKFLHFAVGRSHGLVTDLIFPSQSRLKEGQIAWIAQRCPSLKLLVLPNHLSYVINFEVSSSICKWKDLEGLQISSLIGLKTTIANISKNCPKFSHLSVYVPRLDGDVALAIASQLPHIKTLDLRFSTIQRHDLLLILKAYIWFVIGSVKSLNEPDETVVNHRVLNSLVSSSRVNPFFPRIGGWTVSWAVSCTRKTHRDS